MRRPSRFLVPLTAIASVIVVAFVLSPAGASGGERLHRIGSGDQFLFGRDSVVDSAVPGSLQVYGGNIDVNAPIAGDLLVFGGNVVLRGGGRVGGNLIYAGGNIEGADGRVEGGCTRS